MKKVAYVQYDPHEHLKGPRMQGVVLDSPVWVAPVASGLSPCVHTKTKAPLSIVPLPGFVNFYLVIFRLISV